MNKKNESIDQRISAFISRKAKKFPDIDLRKPVNEEQRRKEFFTNFSRTLSTSR